MEVMMIISIYLLIYIHDLLTYNKNNELLFDDNSEIISDEDNINNDYDD